jgi:transposase-like protein
MSKIKPGRDPIYPASLKIAIAREYLTGNLGFTKLAQKHNLKGEYVPRYFVRWYKEHYPGHTGREDPKSYDAVIPESDRALEKQLKEANLRIAGLEMLIQVAQRELGIDIVKKPGTKQSPK